MRKFFCTLSSQWLIYFKLLEANDRVKLNAFKVSNLNVIIMNEMSNLARKKEEENISKFSHSHKHLIIGYKCSEISFSIYKS